MQAPTQHNAAILKTHRNKATLLSGHFLWSGNGERGRLGKLKSQSTIRDLMYLNYKTKSGGKQLYSEGAGNRFPPISTIKMWGLHLEEAAHNALTLLLLRAHKYNTISKFRSLIIKTEPPFRSA